MWLKVAFVCYELGGGGRLGVILACFDGFWTIDRFSRIQQFRGLQRCPIQPWVTAPGLFFLLLLYYYILFFFFSKKRRRG
jgi:hypothetical protein